MTTVPDIPVVQLPALDADDARTEPTTSIWAVDVPSGRRPSPLTLAVLGVVAGVSAMALGAAAVISAGASSEPSPRAIAGATTPVPPVPSVSAVERRVLALLAKPSTERVVFRGAPGLVLVVGSGGRAAVLVRGLEPAGTGSPYAWIVAPGAPPVRAAQFDGTERAVFLDRRLGPRASVVVSTGRPAPSGLLRNRVVAIRS